MTTPTATTVLVHPIQAAIATRPDPTPTPGIASSSHPQELTDATRIYLLEAAWIALMLTIVFALIREIIEICKK